MLSSLSNSFVLLLMIALGYALKRRGVIGPQHRKLFLTLILNVTMPAAIIAGFDMSLNLGTLLVPFLIGCASCALLNTIAIVWTRGQPGKIRALTLLMSCGFLIAPFTIPFAQANMPQVFMALAAFDVAQSLFNMGTNFVLASALATETRSAAAFSPKRLLHSMLHSAPLVTYFSLLLLRALNWHLPAFALNFFGKVGAANLFLGMTFIGLVLDFRLELDTLRQLARIFAIRYGVALAVSLLCFFVLPLPTLFAKGVTLCLLSPISNASMAYCEMLGCDSKAYGAASSISFLVGIASYAALFLFWA